jgi:hypothetical protein
MAEMKDIEDIQRDPSTAGLTRRELLRLTTTGATALGARTLFPGLAAAAAAAQPHISLLHHAPPVPPNQYAQLLRTWCDGLIPHQVTAIYDPTLHGGLLCPACVLIHGRCADAVYPLLHMAHTSGESKYLQSALMMYEWSEQQVSRADGSWINDVNLSTWKGITVFHAIALAEALHFHGSVLDTQTRKRWTDRLARAAQFLDGFITMQTGNINYPVTSSLCFALCAQALGDHHYQDRAHELAHSSLNYFTKNNLLFGEGHPFNVVTKKGCHPVDLGYNVEESLPALAEYALLTKDQAVLDQAIIALRAHMEFMLPDGGWDNSWGTRNYKWSYWGSRTSDGCQAAYVLLSPYEPKFREVAQRNLDLMAACTHDGLLYGGPDYFAHGDRPCIHHTFSHAKALATVLDRGANLPANLAPTERQQLPCDVPTGLKHYPEIGVHLASVGPWRATVTEYDWEYVERVQASGGSGGGGSASGGAMSFLFHRTLGPILTASMTEYQIIEVANQQTFRDYPHMTLTPRIECKSSGTYTSLSDLEATVTATTPEGQINFDVNGSLQNIAHQPLSTGDINYHLTYNLTESSVTITATATGATPPTSPVQFILPVISQSTETVEQPEPGTIHITKPKGIVIVRTNAPHSFEPVPRERTFNLVPGFECVPLIVTMQLGQELSITIETPKTSPAAPA